MSGISGLLSDLIDRAEAEYGAGCVVRIWVSSAFDVGTTFRGIPIQRRPGDASCSLQGGLDVIDRRTPVVMTVGTTQDQPENDVPNATGTTSGTPGVIHSPKRPSKRLFRLNESLVGDAGLEPATR